MIVFDDSLQMCNYQPSKIKVVLFIILANSVEAQNVEANWRTVKKIMTRQNFLLLHTSIINKKLKVLNPIFIIFYLFEKRKK